MRAKRKSCADRARDQVLDTQLEFATRVLFEELARPKPDTAFARGIYSAVWLVAATTVDGASWPLSSEWEDWARMSLGLETSDQVMERLGLPKRADFHRCKDCNLKVYAPDTRCECGGELYGIMYATRAA
jgi:hypothetical protein